MPAPRRRPAARNFDGWPGVVPTTYIALYLTALLVRIAERLASELRPLDVTVLYLEWVEAPFCSG
jgi:hypothetical protein